MSKSKRVKVRGLLGGQPVEVDPFTDLTSGLGSLSSGPDFKGYKGRDLLGTLSSATDAGSFEAGKAEAIVERKAVQQAHGRRGGQAPRGDPFAQEDDVRRIVREDGPFKNQRRAALHILSLNRQDLPKLTKLKQILKRLNLP